MGTDDFKNIHKKLMMRLIIQGIIEKKILNHDLHDYP